MYILTTSMYHLLLYVDQRSCNNSQDLQGVNESSQLMVQGNEDNVAKIRA